VAEGRDELVRCRHFVTELARLKMGAEYRFGPQRCQLWISVEGRGTIGGEAFQRGEVWLLPETGEQPAIRAEANTRFLRTYVPG
jgi:hypothetical protein